MENLLLVSVLSMGSYLIWYARKYGMTKSISATFKGLRKSEQLYFIFNLWLTAFPIMIVGMLKAPTMFTRLLFFIAGGFVLLVSVAPMYWKIRTLNNRRQALMHYIGSYGGIGVGIIACLLTFTSWPVILVVGAYALFVISQMVLKWTINNYIYWIEVAAIAVAVGLEYFAK